MHKIKPSPEIDTKIISLYQSGKDTYQTAEECGCSQTFVMNTLKRHNIPRRTTYSYTTKYISNEKFFDTIDNEEKAYVLGFFYADGNNYIKGVHNYEISIALQEEDREILERIKDFICPMSELDFRKATNPKWKNMYAFKANSKKLTQQLTELGCIPAKSLTLTWPQWLADNELQRHLIRGYFDGDGSLWAKEPTITDQIDWGWQITSTIMFCKEVRNIVETHANVHCTQKLAHPDRNETTTTISVGGNLQVKRVLDWLYRDANIYMARKYNKYQEFLTYLQSRN